MERREFLGLLGWGLAAAGAGAGLSWPFRALAGSAPEVRLALLADAHLPDGDEGRAEALRLARAVAEIRALRPSPDLVLLAGDLAHRANPRALALGREILADLPAPLLAVMGEGDGLPDAAGPWRRLFGEPGFSHTLEPNPSPGNPSLNLLTETGNRQPQTVIQILGLHAAWCPGPGGPGFYVGAAGRGWLSRELARLDPERPLLVLSHPPLGRFFHPWQQWTGDAPQVLALLSGFSSLLCVHGHVHFPEVWGVGAGGGGTEAGPGPGGGLFDSSQGASTANRKSPTVVCLGLPATAWPGPLALQGTPATRRPGLAPQGCGWGLLTLRGRDWQLTPQLWQA